QRGAQPAGARAAGDGPGAVTRSFGEPGPPPEPAFRGGRMALIADLCPHCQRATRCHVVERVSVVGGMLFGIPFLLPGSSVTFSCAECGCEFSSQTWDHRKTVSPAEASSLDIEELLSLTNPALKETLTLSELRMTPRLSEAFELLDQLAPGSLRTGL